MPVTEETLQGLKSREIKMFLFARTKRQISLKYGNNKYIRSEIYPNVLKITEENETSLKLTLSPQRQTTELARRQVELARAQYDKNYDVTSG